MAAAVLVFFIFAAWPVRAAIELRYFRAAASPNTVLLEWATVSETNISGFIIECKRSDEPDSDYHAIGARDAVGEPDAGAAYSFNIASGLEPGVAYCFRLVETTIDGLPGEQFEICGYGAAVTPTPEGTRESGGFGDGTPSTIIVVPPPDTDLTTPDVTLTPTATVDPFSETPTPSPTFTPVAPISPQTGPEQPESPLPDGDEDEDEDADAANLAPRIEVDGEVDNEVDGESVSDEEPTPTPTLAPATATWTPTPPTSPLAEPTDTPAPEEEALLPGVVAADDVTDALATATPSPLYVVVTSTPTPEALAVAPTFTPWPTITPEPEFSLMAALNPSTQNLMVMLLCLIFLTASGLGTLGLVTSVIYMRSRAQRTEHLSRLYGRRRF
ncbi:MAG: hypothetical protein WDZ49_07845 [Litorilinea sp.]